MRRVVIAVILIAGVSLGAGTLSAQARGLVEMQVKVPAPSTLEEGLRDKTRDELAKGVVRRIEDRLDAAGVKFSSVRRLDTSAVEVKAEAELGVGALRGIVLAPGEFAVRPIRSVGGRWQEKSGELPAGVEIRQEGDSLKPYHAHLWSSDRDSLREFLEDVSIEEVDLFVYSAGDGWRSLALGPPILTDAAVAGAKLRHVSTGSPYVSIDLRPGGRKSFEHETRHLDGRLAAVLDGEVVATLEPSALSQGRLHLTPPEQLDGGEALMDWARQVAGRLAAAIPLELVPIQE